MSYVRFSSDSGKSEVYLYESEWGGFVLHVSKTRRRSDPKSPDPYQWDVLQKLSDGSLPEDDWRAMRKAWNEEVDLIPIDPIDHPNAGESFCDATLEDSLARLIHLRSEGFHIPESAIEAVQRDIVARREDQPYIEEAEKA